MRALNDAVGPTGRTVAESDTGPEKPVLLREIVVVAVFPAEMPRLVGLAEMVKFPLTKTTSFAIWISEPPITVTVPVTFTS